MNRQQPNLSIVSYMRCGTLLLVFLIATPTCAQVSPSKDYFEICRKLGYYPNTTPMRDCIEAKRNNDLDPLNALVEYDLIPPAAQQRQSPRYEADADFSGAESPKGVLERSPEELLLGRERTPEELLLGPGYRAPYQGIYE